MADLRLQHLALPGYTQIVSGLENSFDVVTLPVIEGMKLRFARLYDGDALVSADKALIFDATKVSLIFRSGSTASAATLERDLPVAAGQVIELPADVSILMPKHTQKRREQLEAMRAAADQYLQDRGRPPVR